MYVGSLVYLPTLYPGLLVSGLISGSFGSQLCKPNAL